MFVVRLEGALVDGLDDHVVEVLQVQELDVHLVQVEGRADPLLVILKEKIVRC